MMFQEIFKPKNWRMILHRLLDLSFEEEKEYEITIKEYKEIRSLRANAYSWALTNKLAEKMLVAGVKLSKEEMHAEMIFRYGQPEIQNGSAVIYSVIDGANVTDVYPYAKIVGQGEVNGKLFNHWMIFRGSHTYSRSEMAMFIRGIVEECNDLGIETKTPDEIRRMISLMKEADDG